jgi:Homeodomain-like domain
MHDVALRQRVLEMLEAGHRRRDVCAELGVGYTSTYRWQGPLSPKSPIRCFRCDKTIPDGRYLYLLGQYLGDGHIARSGRSTALRIFCCDDYPRIISEVACAMVCVANTTVNYRELIGCTQVQSATNHWKCMFPQHGPGMKHTRPIVLADWQRDLVAADPRPLIRGLIHSDGCRCTNHVERRLPTGTRHYAYPRYFFSNESADIRGIFRDALDLLGVAWRQNRHNSISVARAEAVEALDEFVGPKS